MTKYEVLWAEVKKTGEKNGKPWAIMNMTLRDPQGKDTENVTTFDTVSPGHFLEGEIETGQYGLSFKKAPTPKQVAGSNFKTQQIENVMNKKNESIKTFQDSKEFSIMVASSMSQSVALAIAEYEKMDVNDPANPELIDLVTKWRKWVIDNWSVDKTDIPAF